ncbi:hypothetical protein GCM10007291_02970 [Gemmobacter nanjingensis]|uniref:Uncharacterized protein n=2 Tax=Gemmobacter nanjingensis TaxID=488454 RepID=A0ABQ3F6Q1_9RHOB|nr:hypothetical protein GCM10007291_02970 [Gemmobacter nanjingensis]
MSTFSTFTMSAIRPSGHQAFRRSPEPLQCPDSLDQIDRLQQVSLRPDGDSAWAIKFSEEWYRLQMPPLKAAFEDDHIALIADSEHVSDLRMVKLIRGIPRVPPVREGEKGRKRHGDYAIALALAYFASRMRWVEYGYVPVPVHDQRVGHNGGPAMFGSEEEGWWRGPLGFAGVSDHGPQSDPDRPLGL